MKRITAFESSTFDVELYFLNDEGEVEKFIFTQTGVEKCWQKISKVCDVFGYLPKDEFRKETSWRVVGVDIPGNRGVVMVPYWYLQESACYAIKARRVLYLERSRDLFVHEVTYHDEFGHRQTVDLEDQPDNMFRSTVICGDSDSKENRFPVTISCDVSHAVEVLRCLEALFFESKSRKKEWERTVEVARLVGDEPLANWQFGKAT